MVQRCLLSVPGVANETVPAGLGGLWFVELIRQTKDGF